MLITVGVCRAYFQAKFDVFLGWVELHPIQGPFVICAGTIITVVFMLPYTLFAVGAGYALSRAFDRQVVTLLVGTASVFAGALLGALIAFLCGRYIFRLQVQRVAQRNKVLRAIEVTMQMQGLKLILLMRLSMIVPFNLSNYVFGASSVRIKEFALGTLGLLPLVTFFVYIGTTVSDI